MVYIDVFLSIHGKRHLVSFHDIFKLSLSMLLSTLARYVGGNFWLSQRNIGKGYFSQIALILCVEWPPSRVHWTPFAEVDYKALVLPFSAIKIHVLTQVLPILQIWKFTLENSSQICPKYPVMPPFIHQTDQIYWMYNSALYFIQKQHLEGRFMHL